MSEVKHVLIVGGGTAGWITAGVLAADHRGMAKDGLRITVIESPNIPTIGVGEGTWPTLRDTFRRIGLAEEDVIRECNASFKQGSRFDGWLNGGREDSYYHPFETPPSEDDLDVTSLWCAASNLSFADAVGSQARLCREGRAPKQMQTPAYAAVANYGYHLDAGALVQLLTKHCVSELGVNFIHDEVVDVSHSSDGSVAAIQAQINGEIEADLFVDCTGHRALLIGDALGAQTTDVSNVLFNDRAWAVHVPHMQPGTPIESQTISTAIQSGWIWDIGLQNRRGVGHVYSSQHTSDDAAKTELLDYLKCCPAGGSVSADQCRLLEFKSGYRQTPWVKNVVAIGMSQGFVEPLEASAIVMVELSAAMLSDSLPSDAVYMRAVGERFNRKCAYRWERIVDFLKLHYVLSEREEPYWAAHRDKSTWTPRLVELVEQWEGMAPSREDFSQSQEMFTAASYAYVLYGMGFEPPQRSHLRRKDMPDRAKRRREQIDARAVKMITGLPTNRELLEHICCSSQIRSVE